VDAVANDKPPQIDGKEALRAVMLAQKLLESGQLHRVLTV